MEEKFNYCRREDVFPRIDRHDDFLKICVGVYGIKLPFSYVANRPSSITHDELVDLIDNQLPPFTDKHYMLLQLARLRDEEWIEREPFVNHPESVPAPSVMVNWEDKSSEEFRRWYLRRYCDYSEGFSPEQWRFAEGLAFKVARGDNLKRAA